MYWVCQLICVVIDEMIDDLRVGMIDGVIDLHWCGCLVVCVWMTYLATQLVLCFFDFIGLVAAGCFCLACGGVDGFDLFDLIKEVLLSCSELLAAISILSPRSGVFKCPAGSI